MKILHTVEFYHPSKGGAQEVVRQISELLVERGHDVTVATRRLAGRSDRVINGVKIREFECSGNSVVGMTGQIDEYRDFVVSGGFDVMMNYAAQQWATDALLPVLEKIACRKVLAPCGFSGLYSPEYEDYFKSLPGYLAHYDQLIFHSDSYRDIDFCRKAGLSRISVIPNGARASEFEPPGEGFRERHGIAEDALMILTVGSHTHWKGHAETIEAFRKAGIENAVLVIIGNTHGSPGCLNHDRVKGAWVWVRSRGRKKIKLLDPLRAEVVAAYHGADLFVFPSNIECSPLVLFEAMASGTPFIANDVGNSREIAGWSGGGLILPTHPMPGAPPGYCRCRIKDLIAAIEAFAHDREQRKSMGKQGHESWQKRFTWESLVLDYEAVYQGGVASAVPDCITTDVGFLSKEGIDFGSAKGRHLEVDCWAVSRWLPSLIDVVDAHPYPVNELMLMAAAYWHVKPQLVIDIGTHQGKSARVWYELSQQSGINSEIHTIDLCDPGHAEFPGRFLGRFVQGLGVKQHIGDGCAVARELLKKTSAERVLLFIDGDHAYESVKQELELLALLKQGAALLHDTFYQPGSTYNHGPWLAIQDYLKDHPAFEVMHTQLGLPGMTYIALTDPNA